MEGILEGNFQDVANYKLAKLEVIRHKSDYDDFYIASKEEAMQQIAIAQEVVELAELFLEKRGGGG